MVIPMRQELDFNLPISMQLFSALRSAIVETRLRPGQALSEKEIALGYGVSRQPVREAFIKLSEAGLVEIRPSRGTYVCKISIREVADARLVREAVECSLARHAAQLASGDDCAALGDLIARQEDAFEGNDFHLFNKFDDAFHRKISNIVQCGYAWKTVEGARTQIDRVRFLSLSSATPTERLIAQHKKILSAIEAKDSVQAEKHMQEHMREILLALPSLAKSNPELFADQEIPDHTHKILQMDQD